MTRKRKRIIAKIERWEWKDHKLNVKYKDGETMTQDEVRFAMKYLMDMVRTKY